MDEVERKVDELKSILRDMDGVLVALSGGVDSSLLTDVAAEVLSDRVLAVTASGPMIPAIEVQRAREVAERSGVRHFVVDGEHLDDPMVRANPPDRCYHCKRGLMARLQELARNEGLPWVAHGEQLDDVGDHRPGSRAAAESGARAPLAEAGFTKADVREASRLRGMPTWNHPPLACLATRIPYGEELTEERLARVDRAEDVLRELGFGALRVRDHGRIARIEVPPGDIERLATEPLRSRVADEFRALGYTWVALDLQGFRSGSMDEARR